MCRFGLVDPVIGGWIDKSENKVIAVEHLHYSTFGDDSNYKFARVDNLWHTGKEALSCCGM